MALPTALLAKGLAGLGIVAAGTTGIVLFINKNSNKEINEKIKALGISGCELGNGETSKTCTLDKAKLEKITFVKGENEAKATGDDISAELTIEKLGDSFKTDFPEGLRFTLKNTKDADLTLGTTNNTITLKKDVGYDFKIKNSTKLEKAWTIETLGAKVGLSCSSGDDATSCTIKTEGINVWKENSGVTNAKTTETSKQVSVAKDQKDYLDGLKFTVTDDITVTSGSNSKQLSKDNKAYEIDLRNDNGTKTWFLVEKDTTGNS